MHSAIYTYVFTNQDIPSYNMWEPRGEVLPKPLPPSNLLVSLVAKLKQPS